MQNNVVIPVEEGKTPTKKPKQKFRCYYWFLIILFVGIKICNGGLAVYSFIVAVQETSSQVDQKYEGKFSVVEMTYAGQKAYFMPRITSSNTSFVTSFSLANNTYSYSEETIVNTPLKYCYVVLDADFARQLADDNTDEAGLFMIKALLACLGLFDVYDVLKGIISRIMRCYKERFDALIPDNLHWYTKVYIFFLVTAPRFIPLNYQGEDYSICVGYTENSSIYNLYSLGTGKNDYRTGPLGSYFTGVYLYGIFFAFYGVYLLGISQYFCLIPKDEKEKQAHEMSKMASIVLGICLGLFGLAYEISNILLVIAQIKNSVAILLSLLYIGRDGLEIILMGFLDLALAKLDLLWESIFSKAGDIFDKASNLNLNQISGAMTANNALMLAGMADEKVENQLDKEEERQNEENEKFKENNTTNKIATTGEHGDIKEEFNKLIE